MMLNVVAQSCLLYLVVNLPLHGQLQFKLGGLPLPRRCAVLLVGSWLERNPLPRSCMAVVNDASREYVLINNTKDIKAVPGHGGHHSGRRIPFGIVMRHANYYAPPR